MITYGEWESYIWKRELESQIRHASIYYDELILDLDFMYHNPLHALEHSIILAAFSIRRMIEKRLLTDKLSKKMFPVNVYYTKDPKEFRKPYYGHSGASVYHNYDLEILSVEQLKIADIVNEIIHASQFMFANKDEKIPPGLLIASDWNMKNRLLHFTFQEIDFITKEIIKDKVKSKFDSWDPETGKVTATRE
jgi:hypothetical protein